jgi:hypothetical protein
VQHYGGEAVKFGERAVLVLVGAGIDAQLQACNALLEGKSGKEALKAAAYRLGVDIVTGGIAAKLDKWAIPVIARLVMDTAPALIGDGTVDKLSEDEKEKGEGEKRRPPGVYTAVPIRLGPSALASMPAPTKPAVCDANAVLSTGSCSPDDWVRQIVLRAA